MLGGEAKVRTHHTNRLLGFQKVVGCVRRRRDVHASGRDRFLVSAFLEWRRQCGRFPFFVVFHGPREGEDGNCDAKDHEGDGNKKDDHGWGQPFGDGVPFLSKLLRSGIADLNRMPGQGEMRVGVE